MGVTGPENSIPLAVNLRVAPGVVVCVEIANNKGVFIRGGRRKEISVKGKWCSSVRVTVYVNN